MIERLQDIRDGVESLSITVDPPEIDGYVWYHPDRNTPDTWRISEIDGEPLFDVGLITEASFNKRGCLEVHAEVYALNVRTGITLGEETIFHDGFNGTYQPREQAMLMNLPTSYQDQINDTAASFMGATEVWAEEWCRTVKPE